MPRVDLTRAPRILAALHGAIQAGLVVSCHDLSEGGLAVAAAEMAFGGGLGMTLDLARVPATPAPDGWDADAYRLFSESCTRFLVEIAPAHAAELEGRFSGLPCALVGEVRAEPVFAVRSVAGRPLFELAPEELRRAFHAAFQG